MKEKEKKPKSKTLSSYRGLKVGKVALYTGVFACPITPATIITLINWEEWFAKSDKSLPFGFASLLVTVVVAIVGAIKSDTVLKKVDIALYYLGGLLMCIGITCLFFASLLSQMGYMWLYTGAGVLASGACLTVEKKVVSPSLQFYKGLVEENFVDKKTRKKQEKIERAKKEAQELKERRRRATTE